MFRPHCYFKQLKTRNGIKHLLFLSTGKNDVKKLRITPVPPSGGTTDWIGPPDPISNIRPIRFYVHPNETLTEKKFRIRRAEVLEWNQQFWADHNSRFFKEKEEYVQSLKELSADSNKNVTQEELSPFYKAFLDKNRITHLNYNKEWYRKNITLLWPALKVSLIRIARKFKKEK
ncbi:COA8 family protein CBG23705, mitochondrial-like [Physella acuta]|uniref:COA8 family protein CBG23705, mitochondrial-like n=1 Tax=Physella acuta TaxID=109671 RepID=UPI0027DCE3A5|nr:COA8 family protein CBG23705, mitochondrial-like [Physella acuta]